MRLFGFESCQIIGIFVKLECGRRRFDVSCLGIVGLHMSYLLYDRLKSS